MNLQQFWLHLVCLSYMPHCPEERYGEKTDASQDGRQAEKGQSSNDLVLVFE